MLNNLTHKYTFNIQNYNVLWLANQYQGYHEQEKVIALISIVVLWTFCKLSETPRKYYTGYISFFELKKKTLSPEIHCTNIIPKHLLVFQVQ